ncbi:MAG: ATP-binding protein [Candidatus Aminicenantes bacterium]|nr:ATP-binding protein [Candidatus Aminicenantes bacterium]
MFPACGRLYEKGLHGVTKTVSSARTSSVSEELLTRTFEIAGGDFSKAGHVSMEIKDILQELGISSDLIRRTAIAAYEAEMNIVMYAARGTLRLDLSPQALVIEVADEGPGIPDIDKAMTEGFSTATPEMREMGFGAGMGLPNIKRNSDDFSIRSTVGRGTDLRLSFRLNKGTAEE